MRGGGFGVISFSRLHKSPERLGASILRGSAFASERCPVGDADQGEQGRCGETGIDTPGDRRERNEGRQGQRGERQQSMSMVIAHSELLRQYCADTEMTIFAE